ncbi:MAG TPA: hypothetical protein VFX17_02605 [Patescibacteria group bacterium]|nr:hypothetical protein [Patescibacteria group bacterium]
MPTDAEKLNQAKRLLTAAGNILLVLGSGSNPDSAAAGLALRHFLNRQGKKTAVLSPKELSKKLSFLPESGIAVQTQIVRSLVLDIGFKNTEVAELSYEKMSDKLRIVVAPKSGQFEPSDVSIDPSAYPYDLVVTLGVARLSDLGPLYASHAPLFFNTPKINIDFRPQNESFGQVNLVDLTSGSVSEIVFDLLFGIDASFVDEITATLLLSGLMSATDGFQNQKASPAAFFKASRLVDAGARQQDIISNLYRTKSLGLLRLWGRVLENLQHEPETNLVYSSLSSTDVASSQALDSDVEEIIFEMKQQLKFAKVFLFLAESSMGVNVYLGSTGSLEPSDVFASYSPEVLDTQVVKFKIPKGLSDVQAEILAKIKEEAARQAA